MSAGLEHKGASALADAGRLARLFADTAAEHDRDGSFPFRNFERLHCDDLLALRTPRGAGGHGASLRDATQVVQTIAKGEPSTALVLAMQYIQHALIDRNPHWPAHLKTAVYDDTLRSGALINALRVERDLGSPARGGLPNTIAHRDEHHWVLSGHKIYSTGAPILSWYVVWARTDEPETRVGNFLVPAGSPGIRIEETWNHLGLRASGSHDVVFDHVRIPLEHAVDIRAPQDWTPDETIRQNIENGVLLAALYQGVAEAARDWLVDFVNTRVPSGLGKSLATLPRVQDVVGSIEMKLRANARLIEGLALDVDSGNACCGRDAYLVKSIVTNNVVDVVEAALSLSGNHGLTRDNPIERHYRDALCGRVHTPQDDSVRLMFGRDRLVRSQSEETA